MGKYRTRAMPKEGAHLTHWIYAVFPHIERNMSSVCIFSHYHAIQCSSNYSYSYSAIWADNTSHSAKIISDKGLNHTFLP